LTNKQINISECEAIIFDIDGVLVDVKKSYNEAIIKTVEHILVKNFDISLNNFPFRDLISKLRDTGGFNNDIDTAYSMVLIILYCILINKMNIDKTVQIFHNILEKLDDKGKDSVEKELAKLGNITSITKKLKYPSNDDMISTIFNEIFYGPILYKKRFNKEPKYYFDKPLITNDILIIKESTMRLLSQKFNGNMGLISGRSKVASYFTLNNIIDYFNENACVFLEDEKREFSKPHAFSLHKVFDSLNLSSALYVGDSMADLLMVENFRKQTTEDRIFFCGVYGDGENTKESIYKKKLLKSNHADVIIKNVNDLPNILNNTKN
jgi:phosphoglycolate phosphatase-like HAD superfamily hydrolase